MKRNQLILVRLIHQFCFGYIYTFSHMYLSHKEAETQTGREVK